MFFSLWMLLLACLVSGVIPNGILLGIATGMALEKAIVIFLHAVFFFSWKMPFGQNYVSLLEESDFSDAWEFFIVGGGAVRREREAVSCCTENTSCKVVCFYICIGFFILSVCTLKLQSPGIKDSLLSYAIL